MYISLQSKYFYVRKVQMLVACVAGAGFFRVKEEISREEEKSEGKYFPRVACIW